MVNISIIGVMLSMLTLVIIKFEIFSESTWCNAIDIAFNNSVERLLLLNTLLMNYKITFNASL